MIELFSFGWGFCEAREQPPFAHKIVDIRYNLRNVPPKQILQSSGMNLDVQWFVLETPGALEVIADIVALARAQPIEADYVIGIGCQAGRHRSVAIVEIVAAELKKLGRACRLRHIHYDWAMDEKPLFWPEIKNR